MLQQPVFFMTHHDSGPPRMNRRSLVLALLLLLLLPGFCDNALGKPNVVIFLADDAGWGDYTHSGNTQVRTPHIDSIAHDGVSLDRFFVCPVCSPTRAEFFTGRYHPRGGVRGVSTGYERLNLDEKTFADAFKAAGYATGAFGKWHNGSQWPYHPKARGFDEYFGYTSGHWGEYFDAPLEENGRMIRTKGYIVDVCTERAINFIEKHKDGPFLCYVPFTTPHSPWAAPEEEWQRFKNKAITQTATNPAREVADETRCVLAMMENQDANVGRVLAKLREHKLEENTIVLYFSDNGPNSARWNGGMKGVKAGTDEGSVRSVCYIRWPAKLPAGHTVTQIAGAIDLLPTLTALAGIPRAGDRPLDGRDLTPLLTTENVEWPERMIFSTWGGNVSVRTQTQRLDQNGKLFDMIADPGQTTPINATQPERVAQLLGAVKAWRREMFGSSEELKTKPGVARNGVDPRPLPVGYREFPITMLPARDGEPRGGVKRSSGAPNCSYFVNWKSPSDSMVWLVDVHTAGRYEAAIDYTCPESDAGSTIELACREARLTAKVTPGWDPPLYTNQDTLPRPHGESQMKEFRTLNLGEIQLSAGQAPLILRAREVPGNSVMDVRRVTLTLLN
jgi:arylsulfatase A-like enzyme